MWQNEKPVGGNPNQIKPHHDGYEAVAAITGQNSIMNNVFSSHYSRML